MACIFCDIVSGSVNAVKIWEDENFIAILDTNPNVEGMTLVLSKKHYHSYIFDMDDELYKSFMLAGKRVAKLLEKGLEVKRVALVMEGTGIDHSHLKLYPMYGLGEVFEQLQTATRIYFKTYKGYISTQLGPKKGLEDLEKVATKIKIRTQGKS